MIGADDVRVFQERVAGIFAAAGFPRAAARVLLLLMVSDDGLTAAEISERIGLSPAAVSGAVRYLHTIGLVLRRPVPGSRRDRYEVVADAWYRATMTNHGVYRQIADAATDGARALPVGSPARIRVDEMRDFFLFLQRRMGSLMDEWETERADPV